MFSISELARASWSVMEVSRIAWFGIVSPMPFSSARDLAADSAFFSTGMVSIFSEGGRRGRPLYGFKGSKAINDSPWMLPDRVFLFFACSFYSRFSPA
jgi:hypothetical protein